MGAAVAAVIMRKERDVVDQLRYMGAVSPTTARPIYDLGVDEDVGFRRLRAREVVREAAPGSFYLDEGVWTAVRRTRRRLALTMAAMAIILGGGVALGFFTL